MKGSWISLIPPPHSPEKPWDRAFYKMISTFQTTVDGVLTPPTLPPYKVPLKKLPRVCYQLQQAQSLCPLLRFSFLVFIQLVSNGLCVFSLIHLFTLHPDRNSLLPIPLIQPLPPFPSPSCLRRMRPPLDTNSPCTLCLFSSLPSFPQCMHSEQLKGPSLRAFLPA